MDVSGKETFRLLLPESFVPHDTDILIGRGRRVVNHPGNRNFRSVIAANLADYSMASSKQKKSAVILRVFSTLMNSANTGFIKRNSRTKRWMVIEDSSARVTIAQAFRDALTIGYRSSKQFKQVLRTQKKKNMMAAADVSHPIASEMFWEDSVTSYQGYDAAASCGPSLARTVTDDTILRENGHWGKKCLHRILDATFNVIEQDTRKNVSTRKPESFKGDTFLTLYNAFGIIVDPTKDPFEPTPLPDTKLTAGWPWLDVSSANMSGHFRGLY